MPRQRASCSPSTSRAPTCSSRALVEQREVAAARAGAARGDALPDPPARLRRPRHRGRAAPERRRAPRRGSRSKPSRSRSRSRAMRSPRSPPCRRERRRYARAEAHGAARRSPFPTSCPPTWSAAAPTSSPRAGASRRPTGDVAAAQAQFYPNINLVAFVGLSTLGLEPAARRRQPQYGIGPAIRLPIFDAGRLRADLRGRTADLDAAVESYNGTLVDAIHDVADQISSTRSVERQQTRAGRRAAAAEARLRPGDAALPRRPRQLPHRAQRREQRAHATAPRRRLARPRHRHADAAVRALGGGYVAPARCPSARRRTIPLRPLERTREASIVRRNRTPLPGRATAQRRNATRGAARAPSASSLGAGLRRLLVRWYSSHYESTDNAYVQGNVVQVTPQVGGHGRRHRRRRHRLRQGRPAAGPARPGRRAGRARAGRGQLAQTVREVRTMYVNNGTLRAQIAAREADMARAQSRRAARPGRRRPARAAGAPPARSARKSSTTSPRSSAPREAASRRRKSAREAAREQLASNQSLTEGIRSSSIRNVLRAAARCARRYLALRARRAAAPVDGYVARRSVQIGQRVQAGTPLLSVVALKERLGRCQLQGRPAAATCASASRWSSTADVYGKKVEYHGTVEGLGAGTGAAFALLPAQNATGNWIKVVQRVPVRIALDPKEVAEHPLRVGLSMDAKVDVSRTDGKTLADAAPRPASRADRGLRRRPGERGRRRSAARSSPPTSAGRVAALPARAPPQRARRREPPTPAQGSRSPPPHALMSALAASPRRGRRSRPSAPPAAPRGRRRR